MKNKDFLKVLRDIPVCYPYFEVIGVPDWATDFIKKGDVGYWHSGALVINGTRLDIGSSYLKFLEYRKWHGCFEAGNVL